jgi:TonB family protein
VDLSDSALSTRTPSRNSDSAAQARAAEQALAAEQAANNKRMQQEIAGTFAALDSSIHSKDSSVKMATLPGEGGGEAFVSYDNVVFNAYYNAWRPEVATRRLPVAVVKIVVSRNGSITSSEFVTKSGDPMLDRSVQRALDAVKDLPPFPPNATAAERSFIITFDPKALQSAG